jgi:hypothetical protein
MQVKTILYTLSILNNINALAFPKREIELRNKKDDVFLNKRLPKQSRKGRETELRNGNDDIFLNKRLPKQSRNGRNDN